MVLVRTRSGRPAYLRIVEADMVESAVLLYSMVCLHKVSYCSVCYFPCAWQNAVNAPSDITPYPGAKVHAGEGFQGEHRPIVRSTCSLAKYSTESWQDNA